MSSKGRDLLKLSGIIAIAFALGLGFASALNLPRPGVAETRSNVSGTAASSTTHARPLRGTDGGPASFADVVDRVNPSIVFITTRVPARASQQPHQDVPPEFQEFFRRFQQQQPRNRTGQGTGFIVSRDGYILTNNHVVADADQIRVKLLDNREFDGRLVGRDPNTDVAVIKINASSLPAVSFGNSDQARIGDWVLAFGNPLGFTFTVTSGIVSAKGRQLDLRDENASLPIQDFIQTDAAINPGNSGGPLVNLNGEVVGINSAIASSTGLYAGYGFAIPSNLAKRVMDDLISKGHVDRAVLGIGINPVTDVDAAAVGLTEIRGVLVSSYSGEDSPAKRAGLQLGDVIVAVNDTAIDHMSQLQQMVGFKHPGESVKLTIVRRDQPGVHRSFNVRLIAAEQTAQHASRETVGPDSASAATEGRLGVRVVSLTNEDIQQAHLTDDMRGVVVQDVEDGGPSSGKLVAAESGSPDIITQVNQTRVRSPEEFKRALRAVPTGGVVTLTVVNLRGGNGAATRVVNVRSR